MPRTPKSNESPLGASALGVALLLSAQACSLHLFSNPPAPDQSRPVVRIETTGGVEYGVGTEFGVVFLGRTANEGPVRVYHFYGPDLVVDDGRIEPLGGLYMRAAIVSAHQRAPFHKDVLTQQDRLFAMVFDEDGDVDRRRVRLTADKRLSGDVLDRTSFELPAGTGIFVVGENEHGDETLELAGLIAGKIELGSDTGEPDEFWVFTGPERLREALAVPESATPRSRVVYRGDDVWSLEPVERTTTDPVRRDS